jgi:hypothetical protein
VRDLLNERPPANEFQGYAMALLYAVDEFLEEVGAASRKPP